MLTEVIATHDDYGTTVRVARGGVVVHSYYVNVEDGDWRSTLPAGSRVVVDR
jgi:hypothetical protein